MKTPPFSQLSPFMLGEKTKKKVANIGTCHALKFVLRYWV